MKRALFIHDHRFYEIDGQFYSPGRFTKANWDRYLSYADEIVVVSRGEKLAQNRNGLILSSKKGVQFDPVWKIRGGYDYYRYAKAIKRRIEKYARELDFVILRVPSSFGLLAYEVCKKHGIPYVTEVVGCAWDAGMNYGSIPVKMSTPLRYMMTKKIVKDSFATLYVTESFLQNRYPTKAEITINASNVEIPMPDGKILASRLQLLKEEKEVIRIGMVGDIAVKYKGYDVAFQALNMFRKKNKEKKFILSLAGGGDPDYVMGLAEKYGLTAETEILGNLKAGEEVFEFLDSLDLYIHPSRTEGLPRAVIEAMSRGCPILASNAGGIPELISPAYLHNPGDYYALYSDIKKTFADQSERLSMATENFERSKMYTSEILIERRKWFYKKAFERIAENSGVGNKNKKSLL